MGIMMTFAIETKNIDGSWKLYNEDGIYDKDGAFESYLGSVHSTEVKGLFPVNVKGDEYEAFYKDLSIASREVLFLVPGIYPEYGISVYRVEDILDMPIEKIEGIRWYSKIECLKKMHVIGVTSRLIMVFN